MTDSTTYSVFSKVSNPKDLLITKEIIKDGEEYYEILDNEALCLFYKKEP